MEDVPQNDQEVPEKTVEDISVPEGFTFEMSGEHIVTLVVQDESGNPWPNVYFEFFTKPMWDGGDLLAKGMTDGEGRFTTTLSFPYQKKAIYAFTPEPGLIEGQRIELNAAEVVHEWGLQGEPADDAVYRFAADRTFECNPGFYQVVGKTLKRLYVTAKRYVSLGDASFSYNGIGMNPEDLYLYGVYKNNDDLYLWRIDNTGKETNLGKIEGISGGGYNYKSDFDETGNLWNVNNVEGVWKLVKIDVDNFPIRAETTNLTAIGEIKGIHDVTYNSKFKKFYAMDQPGNLVEVDPTALTIQRIADYSSTINGTFGALWSDASGSMYVSENKTGYIFEIEMNDDGTPKTIKFLMEGDKASNNDGASCALAPSPFDDDDDDGVLNDVDDYPNDPEIAFGKYGPSAGNYGSYAFEDMWPNKGDYDFNDFVVDYNYEYGTLTNGRIKEIRCTFEIRAIGGTFQKGFGISFEGLSPDQVTAVSGISPENVSLAANNTEAGQSKAVVIITDHVHKFIGLGGNYLVNTGGENSVTMDPYKFQVIITLADAVSDVGKINPFIFIGGNRGHEIHLKGYPATDLVDNSLFGQGNDFSTGPLTYQSNLGLPWGLHFPKSFNYPKERLSILRAYPNFERWVATSGVSSQSWYELSEANPSSIFNP